MRFRPSRRLAPLLALVCAFTACAWHPLNPSPETTIHSSSGRDLAAGPFTPDWPSLVANNRTPEWFRDAKFGIWAHWSAQCVPEQGDWYARSMYMQGLRQYRSHVANFGHPTEFGFMEIDNLWKADKWDPERLMQLYVDAGAKYFVALANHEDNFDTFDSKYQPWNSMNVGPHKDIIGTWAKAAREHGLRFGVSNHSSHAWHWFQTAYGYDAEGPKAGIRYDAYRLTKADGKGKWWEGLDPKDLYVGPSMVIPDGFTNAKAMQQWHDTNDLKWTEEPPTSNTAFVDKWFLRAQDLVDKYHPDFFYMDNTGLPLGQAGLDFAAHYYNANMAYHGGKLEAVLADKGVRGNNRSGITPDFERGLPAGLRDQPFNTDTCIGQWHYQRDIDYKSVGQVVRMLVDVVSKNGNLLLSIPQRGDGTIDEREETFLKNLAAWMKVNGEAIYSTRPWRIYGEGPTPVPAGRAGDAPIPFTQDDIRFTTKGTSLYAFVLSPPTKPVFITALGAGAENPQSIQSVRLLGSSTPPSWFQDDDALIIQPPTTLPCADVIAYEIKFK